METIKNKDESLIRKITENQERQSAYLLLQMEALIRICGDKKTVDVVCSKPESFKLFNTLGLLVQKIIVETIVSELTNNSTTEEISEVVKAHKLEMLEKICTHLSYDSVTKVLIIDGERY